ncbi:hypothetical protein B0H14DRAFT_2630338 [Mycena olivaceomarginata]|nr:hypothetical protein B0H14DRAFT_2630338 [Mycena olivaceomarginata]
MTARRLYPDAGGGSSFSLPPPAPPSPAPVHTRPIDLEPPRARPPCAQCTRSLIVSTTRGGGGASSPATVTPDRPAWQARIRRRVGLHRPGPADDAWYVVRLVRRAAASCGVCPARRRAGVENDGDGDGGGRARSRQARARMRAGGRLANLTDAAGMRTKERRTEGHAAEEGRDVHAYTDSQPANPRAGTLACLHLRRCRGCRRTARTSARGSVSAWSVISGRAASSREGAARSRWAGALGATARGPQSWRGAARAVGHDINTTYGAKTTDAETYPLTGAHIRGRASASPSFSPPSASGPSQRSCFLLPFSFVAYADGFSATSPNAECRMPRDPAREAPARSRDGAGPASGAAGGASGATAAVASGAAADVTLENENSSGEVPCPRAAKERVCGGRRGECRAECGESSGVRSAEDGEKSELGDSGYDTELKDESYPARVRREAAEVDVDVARRYVCGVGSGRAAAVAELRSSGVRRSGASILGNAKNKVFLQRVVVSHRRREAVAQGLKDIIQKTCFD